MIKLVLKLMAISSFFCSFKLLANSKKNDLKESVYLVRTYDNKVLYQKNSKKLLCPASVAKLISSAALLDYFGPHYRFSTNFYYNGKIKEKTLFGDLIIKGFGDPMFVSEDLWKIVANIKNKGIDSIRGDILIDNSFFIKKDKKNNVKRNLNRAYEAPISAFAVNFNTVTVSIDPAENKNSLAKVTLDPYPLSFIKISNSVRTQTSKKAFITQKAYGHRLRNIILTGSIPYGSASIKKYFSVVDPIKSSGEIVKTFLSSFGVKVVGKVKRYHQVKNKKVIVESSK